MSEPRNNRTPFDLDELLHPAQAFSHPTVTRRNFTPAGASTLNGTGEQGTSYEHDCTAAFVPSTP